MEAYFKKKLGERSGKTKDGKDWAIFNFLMETKGKYPKMVSLDAWNANAEVAKGMKEGDLIEVTYEAEARGYNEKWYNSLKVVKLELLESGAESSENDLPF
jgi:hypothetical protein